MPEDKRREALPDGKCVYCWENDAETTDHVPPKNLFPKPRPSTLVTVPACRDCNEEASKDDEYLRWVLTVGEHVGKNPHASVAGDTSIRAIKRPEAAGFQKLLMDATHKVVLVSPEGDLAERLAYGVDWERVYRVIGRTVKGLYFGETGRALPPDCKPRIYMKTAIESRTGILSGMVSAIGHLLSQPPKVISEGVFSYWVDFREGYTEASLWCVRFYESFDFVVVTGTTV